MIGLMHPSKKDDTYILLNTTNSWDYSADFTLFYNTKEKNKLKIKEIKGFVNNTLRIQVLGYKHGLVSYSTIYDSGNVTYDNNITPANVSLSNLEYNVSGYDSISLWVYGRTMGALFSDADFAKYEVLHVKGIELI